MTNRAWMQQLSFPDEPRGVRIDSENGKLPGGRLINRCPARIEAGEDSLDESGRQRVGGDPAGAGDVEPDGLAVQVDQAGRRKATAATPYRARWPVQSPRRAGSPRRPGCPSVEDKTRRSPLQAGAQSSLGPIELFGGAPDADGDGLAFTKIPQESRRLARDWSPPCR